MVIEGTRCHENSRLHRDRRPDRRARVGCVRAVSARQVVVSRRSWNGDATERESVYNDKTHANVRPSPATV